MATAMQCETSVSITMQTSLLLKVATLHRQKLTLILTSYEKFTAATLISHLFRKHNNGVVINQKNCPIKPFLQC